MKRWQIATVIAGLVLALAVVNALVFARERLLRDGQVVLLELAPVDPRSLMQGDYMALDYALARELTRAGVGNVDEAPRMNLDGYAILALDGNGVARLVREQPAATPREAGQVALEFRRRGLAVTIASNAWFFAEGTAALYEPARYGELRVSDGGNALLTGLRDAAFRPLPAPSPLPAAQ
jgi:uncharacterized membrane-anchored protein